MPSRRVKQGVASPEAVSCQREQPGTIGELTTIYPDLKLDYIYVTAAARQRLTDPAAFVIRPEYCGETGAQFEGPYSDHLPVLVDCAITAPSAPAITHGSQATACWIGEKSCCVFKPRPLLPQTKLSELLT